MNHFELIDIIAKSTSADNERDKERFLFYFRQFYSLPILRTNLNFIAQKVKNGEISFYVKLDKNWDFLEYHNNLENPKVIIIASLDVDKIMGDISFVVARYMSNLLKDFDKIILADLVKPNYDNLTFQQIALSNIRNDKDTNIRLLRAITRNFPERLENKNIKHSYEELYSSFFMTIPFCHEVMKWNKKKRREDEKITYSNIEEMYCDSAYSFEEFLHFFKNTTRWFLDYFNPIVDRLIDNYIIESGNDVATGIENYEKTWMNESHDTPLMFANDKKKLLEGRANLWYQAWKEYEDYEKLEKEKKNLLEDK